MRVGAALRTLGVDLSGLVTCVNYNRNRFSVVVIFEVIPSQQSAIIQYYIGV